MSPEESEALIDHEMSPEDCEALQNVMKTLLIDDPVHFDGSVAPANDDFFSTPVQHQQHHDIVCIDQQGAALKDARERFGIIHQMSQEDFEALYNDMKMLPIDGSVAPASDVDKPAQQQAQDPFAQTDVQHQQHHDIVGPPAYVQQNEAYVQTTPPQEPPPPAWFHAHRQCFAWFMQHRAKSGNCSVPTKGEWLELLYLVAEGEAGTRAEETTKLKDKNRRKTINVKKLQLQQAAGTGVQNFVLISTETPHKPRIYVHQEEVFPVLTGLLRKQPTLPNSSLRNVKESLNDMKQEVQAKYRNIPDVLIEDFFRALDAAYFLFGIYDYGVRPTIPRPQGSIAFESHPSLSGEYPSVPSCADTKLLRGVKERLAQQFAIQACCSLPESQGGNQATPEGTQEMNQMEMDASGEEVEDDRRGERASGMNGPETDLDAEQEGRGKDPACEGGKAVQEASEKARENARKTGKAAVSAVVEVGAHTQSLDKLN